MAAKTARFLAPWIDVLAIVGWGALFLKYWTTGKLYLLIHPNYFGLTIAAGFALVLIAVWRSVTLIQSLKRPNPSMAAVQHLSVFPPGWGSALLLATAIFGFTIAPRPFVSQTAIDRGITDTAMVTRVKPQAFRGTVNPEDKSLVEWIRTLTVYPEPDAYTGQKVRLQGFVVHPPNLSNEYFLISRFILTCCAADAYPISLPVKLPPNQRRDAYKPDSWQEIEGQMITETLVDKRQLVIQAKAIKPIEEPKNPYDY